MSKIDPGFKATKASTNVVMSQKAPDSAPKKSKFEQEMDKLLAILMSGFTNATHDPRLKIISHKDENGFGRSEASIWTDANTQVRLLQSKQASHTDLRSIVTRRLNDGTILSVTSASQNNSKGELTAQWYRYGIEKTLGDDKKSAKDTLIKLFNLKGVDTNKDIKIKDDVRVLCDAKGNKTGYEFTKIIKYTDTAGKEHEQKVVVTTNAKGEHQKVEMTLDNKKQKSPPNIDIIANYVHQDIFSSYAAYESDFDELGKLGDYGAFNGDQSNGTNEGGGSDVEALNTLVKLLQQFLAQVSANGPSSFNQIYDLLKKVTDSLLPKN